MDWKQAQQKAALTARWAVTMAKVRIRRVASRTRWQLVTFYGKGGSESVGVVASRTETRRGLGNSEIFPTDAGCESEQNSDFAPPVTNRIW